MTPQVDKHHYFSSKYCTMDRFISYYEQIHLLQSTGAKKILIVGVGDGVVPDYLKKFPDLQITTLDIDPALEPDVVGDIQALPFADNQFDAAAIFEVLEHLPFETFEKCLQELKRVSKTHVVISIPYRQTSFEAIFRFPGIRTITNRDYLRFLWRIPLVFGGFAKSGQHYWEIDRTQFRLSAIRETLKKYFTIAREQVGPLDAYRLFFVLQKNESSLDNAYVKEHYNNYLQKLPEDYTLHRWLSHPADILDYNQTKKSLQTELGDTLYTKVLEIGPGDGVWTKEIRPQCSEYHVVDQSEEMLARLQKKMGDSIQYHLGDFLHVEVTPGFDLIVAVRCFEYFEEQPQSLAKMFSLLRPGGKLIIVTKNLQYIRSAARDNKKILHTRQRSKIEMETMLQEAGFTLFSSYPATVRVKARFAFSRFFFTWLHGLIARPGRKSALPTLVDKSTESYIYTVLKP